MSTGYAPANARSPTKNVGVDSTPASQKALVDANKIYRSGEAAAVAQAEAIVKAHVDGHAELMAIAPADRAAAHGK